MTKYFKFFLIILFVFKILPAVDFPKDLQSQDSIVLQRLDKERIEEKQEFFRNLFDRKKKFRQNVFITAGAIPVAGLLAYLGYKILKNDDQNGNSNSSTSKDTSSYSRDRLSMLELWKKEGISGLCKYGFFKGIGEGIYWGISAVIVSSFMAFQSKLFKIVPDKFNKLWNGDDEQRFLLIRQHLGINLEQLLVFFKDQSNIICDKQEIKDNYTIFIDAVETFLSFTKEKLADRKDVGCYTQEPILNGLYSFVVKIDNFSDKLQTNLNQTDSAFFDEKNTEKVWQDFKLLNNQFIRFFNLCYNIFYEKQAIS